MEKRVAFFDVETTGVDVVKDRIVSIAIITIEPDGFRTEFSCMVNPTVPIPKEASDIHGITDDMVADCPKFADIAVDLFDRFRGCDIGGFNSNRFDVPMLAEEFARCGLNFMDEKRKYFDAYKIFAKKEKRDLAAAYRHYCGQELEGAHDALVDVKATVEVFLNQITMYEELSDADAIHEFCEFGNRADFTGHLIYDEEGELVYNFGKHEKKRVTANSDTRNYAKWMLDQGFSSVTKKLLRQALQ